MSGQRAVAVLSQDVVAVAAHGLAGSRLDPPAGPLAAERWAGLVRTCRANEMVGYLAGAVDGGRLAVTAAQASELADLEAEGVAVGRRVEQELARLARALSAAGIDFRLADGPARAQLAFADPRLRHVAEAQVVVEPGYIRLATATTDGEVRVRTTALPPGVSSTLVDLTDLGSRAARLTLGDQRLAALPPEEQLVCAAAEVAMEAGARQLARLRDVAELVLVRGLDAVRVHRLAEGWGVADPLAAAIRTAWQTFGLADQTALSVWAQRVQPPAVGGGGRRRRLAWRRADSDTGGARSGVGAAVSRLVARIRPVSRPALDPIEVQP